MREMKERGKGGQRGIGGKERDINK